MVRAIRIRQVDLLEAMAKTNPSSLREKAVEVPDTTWADVGGLELVKQELMETVMYPVQYAHKYAKFGMNPSRSLRRPRLVCLASVLLLHTPLLSFALGGLKRRARVHAWTHVCISPCVRSVRRRRWP